MGKNEKLENSIEKLIRKVSKYYPQKIEEVIQHIISDELSSTDKLNRYSEHHYSLR